MRDLYVRLSTLHPQNSTVHTQPGGLLSPALLSTLLTSPIWESGRHAHTLCGLQGHQEAVLGLPAQGHCLCTNSHPSIILAMQLWSECSLPQGPFREEAPIWQLSDPNQHIELSPVLPLTPTFVTPFPRTRTSLRLQCGLP